MRRLAWLTVMLATLHAGPPIDSAELLGPSTASYAVGVRPRGIAVVDLDLDGALDLVVANSGGATADVLAGDGAGGFAREFPLSVIEAPRSVVAPDLDRDDLPDVVVASRTGLTVAPGDGSPPVSTALGSSLAQVATGDLDADGRVDLVAIETGGEVWVLPGDGAGGFSVPALLFVVDGQARSVTVGDFDGNGHDDLAVASSGHYVAIFSSDEAGGFSRTDLSLPSGASPAWVGAAPLREGTALDLVVANQGRRTLSVFLGDGAGGFLPAYEIALEGVPSFAAFADFDGDGTQDLAVLERTAELLDPMSILLGDGEGGFARVSRVPVDSDPLFLAVADLNRDGARDVITANTTSDSVSVFLGNGLGGFRTAPVLEAGAQPEAIAIADFDADGQADFAVTDNANDSLRVARGDGRGGFSPPEILETGIRPEDVVVGRFDGDDLPDLVVANGTSGTLCVYRGTFDDPVSRTGHFFSGDCATEAGGLPVRVAVGDFDEDGFDDLVVTHQRTLNNSASVLRSDGEGGFPGARVELPVAPGFGDVAVGFLDDDPHLDIALCQSNPDTVRLWLGDGTLGFRSPDAEGVSVGRGPADLAVADFNGDGWSDLAVAAENDDSVTLLLGDGTGAFVVGTVPAGERPRAIAVADLNRDSIPDLAVVAADSNALFPLLGRGDGTFTRQPGLALPTQPWAVATAELDADLDPDLAVVSRVDGSVSVLLSSLDARSDVNGSNRIDGTDVAEIGRRASDSGRGPSYVRRADVNVDGAIDGDDLALVGASFGGLRLQPSPLRGELVLEGPPGAAEVTVAPGGSEGDRVYVDIVADTEAAVAGAAFTLRFDADELDAPPLLELVGSTPGTWFDDGTTQALDTVGRTPGSAGVSLQSLPPSESANEGPTLLATLVLRARREGTVRLSFDESGDAPARLLTADGTTVPGIDFAANARIEIATAGDDDIPGQRLGVFPDRIDFGAAAPGTTRKLRISNFGYSELRIEAVSPSRPEFFTLPGSVPAVSVPPFGYVELRVGFAGAGAPVEGDLRIVSNDPLQGTFRLPLQAGD